MLRACSFRSGAALVALLLSATQLRAQQWSLEAQAGRIRSALDPAAASTQSVLLGVRYDDARSGLRLSFGVPTTSEAALWATLAAGTRLAARHNSLLAGLDLAGHGFVLQDRTERTSEVPGLLFPRIVREPGQSGHAIAGQLLPVVGFESLRLQAFARAGVSHYTASYGEQKQDRTVGLADVQVTVAPTPILAITPLLRLYSADSTSYAFAGVIAAVAPGPLGLWASLGQWLEAPEQSTAWAAGASLRVQDRINLTASARRDVFDPLYGSAPQTSWNAGLSVRIGALPTARAPIPAAYENGRATIQLPVAQSARAPSIAGDFNNWKPQPMQRSGNHWTFTVALARGVYDYAFVNERGEWFVPEKYPGRKDDGMGGHVAVLVVS